LFSSRFDANGGLFATLLGARTPSSPRLNHASIIDVRLCKAQRTVTKQRHGRPGGQAQGKALAPHIATDGVFSMDGTIANLPAVCDLADKYDALVMVDDSHAVGFGETRVGTLDLA
jgi:glycine C-acetyltransferase